MAVRQLRGWGLRQVRVLTLHCGLVGEPQRICCRQPSCGLSHSALRTNGCTPTTMQSHSQARNVSDSALWKIGGAATTMRRHSDARTVPDSALRTSGCTPTMQWHSQARNVSDSVLRSGGCAPMLLLSATTIVWVYVKTPVDETGFSFVYGCLCVKLLGRR